LDSALQKELRRRIEAFVTDLEGLVRRAALQAVADALGGGSVATAPRVRASTKKPAPKPAKAIKAAPKKRVRRSAADLERAAAAILDHVTRNPGQGAEQIKAALGIPTAAWALPVKKLLDEGRIAAKGAKRSTTYVAK
jgi:hypothetical protein